MDDCNYKVYNYPRLNLSIDQKAARMNLSLLAMVLGIAGCATVITAGTMSFFNILYTKNLLPTRWTLIGSLVIIGLSVAIGQPQARLFVDAYSKCFMLIGILAMVIWATATFYARKKLDSQTWIVYPHSQRLALVFMKYFSAGCLINWLANY